MKLHHLLRLTILSACVSLFSAPLFAGEIAYNCFVSNERRVSPTVLEFDVYVQATGTESFKLRTVQNSYTLNPSFVNGATVNVSYVQGSSEMPSFVSNLKWSNAGNGFTSTANVAGTCSSNGIIVPVAPASVKVATYKITAVAGSFGTAPSQVKFVKQGEADPASDLRLKMAVSRWDDMNCVKGSSSAVKYKEASASTNISQKAVSTLTPSLFPNPSAGKTTLSFNSNTADKYIVKVFDATGHLVLTESIASAVGYNSRELNLEGQAAGRYTLSIQTNDSDKESLQLIIE